MPQTQNEDIGAAFLRLRQGLRGYLRKRLRDSQQADDLLQDVFVKLLVSERAGRRVENLTGWLYAAARTTLVDHYRATGMPTETLDENIADPQSDDSRLHQALAACLRPFVEQLAPIYRDTLIAIDFEGEAARVVAERQKVSVSAIKSRASRARATLREKVLACCHVEMQDGLVSDYYRIAPADCEGHCASGGEHPTRDETAR